MTRNYNYANIYIIRGLPKSIQSIESHDLIKSRLVLYICFMSITGIACINS